MRKKVVSQKCCCLFVDALVRCSLCSLCAAPGCDPTGMNRGTPELAPHLSCRSSERGFILRGPKKMQSPCLCYSEVSCPAPARRGTTAMLCLLRGCAGARNHALFSPMVPCVLASKAKHLTWGPGFLQPTARLKNRFCSAVDRRTERAPEACVHQAVQRVS